MNASYSQVWYLLLVAAIIAIPAQAMDYQAEVSTQQHSEVNSPEQVPVVWYKKQSTQKIASAVIVASVLAYALAVRMNKIASPVALFTALFCSQVNKVTVANVGVAGPKNDGQKQESNVQTQTQENKTNDGDVVVNPSVQTLLVQENQLSNDDKGQLSGHQVNVDNDEVGPVHKGDNQPEHNLANQLKQLISAFSPQSFFHKSTEADFDRAEKDFSQLI